MKHSAPTQALLDYFSFDYILSPDMIHQRALADIDDLVMQWVDFYTPDCFGNQRVTTIDDASLAFSMMPVYLQNFQDFDEDLYADLTLEGIEEIQTQLTILLNSTDNILKKILRRNV